MIKQRALDEFRSTLRGDVLLPQDADYDATRRIFNATCVLPSTISSTVLHTIFAGPWLQ